MPKIRFQTADMSEDFPDGTDVNVLRFAIRHDVPLPWRCGSGKCGTDRIHIVEGGENLDAPRRRERERLGPLLDEGYRLACQTYACGDVTVTWDPEQKGLDEDSEQYAKLKARWLAKADNQ
ncbi:MULTISPECIES: 2Fe-2S iron-sulfur cluster-binding protein [unclassified Mycolicibacterium]|uniref:2Fe-2S iron-sulfur cluster-binding protein n=1 Tax=unclassified Mycolicibacterium TaxID=2636767 RepID=UPI001F4C0195|nr:2Fe-2S iron-sulfur cluster-binding protein [Mycolicibacterium sp. YH-1]UNB52192.1 (2Fe-2S)-binding protein [Mycolicibacterium sp. YH-1]